MCHNIKVSTESKTKTRHDAHVTELTFSSLSCFSKSSSNVFTADPLPGY